MLNAAGNEPTSLTSRDLWLALALMGFVLVVHRLIGAAVGADGSFIKYGIAAQQHLHGDLPAIRQMDLSPLYFEFNVLLQRLSSGNDMALDAVAWIQRFAVASSAGLFYLMAASRLPRGWAVLAACVFAFEPHVLVYEYVYEPEVLMVFCLLACVVLVERRAIWCAAPAGLFAALAIASRPTFLVLFLVLGPVYFALRGERGRDLALRSVAFLLPVLLCAVLLAVRADRITGDAAAPVMNPGTVFFEGTHPLSRGTSAAYPPSVASMLDLASGTPDEAHVRYREVARIDLQRNVTIADTNAFWTGKALAFVFDEPWFSVKRLGEKFARIFRDTRWHDVSTADDLEKRLPTVPGFYAALSALALVGLLVRLRFLHVDGFLYAYAVVQLGVMLVFYVSARQQMVLVVPLVFFAVAAAHAMTRSRNVAIWGALAFIPSFAFFLGASDVTKDHVHQIAGGMRAEAFAKKIRDLDSSTPLATRPDLVAEVIASASWFVHQNVPGNVGQEPDHVAMAAARLLRSGRDRDFFSEFDLATLELEAGDLQSARVRFEALVKSGRLPYRSYWQASDPLYYLGRIAGFEGKREQAISYLEQALERTPGDPFVLAELAVLAKRPELRDRITRYYSTVDAQLLLGEAMLAHGHAAEAIDEFKALVANVPRFHRAFVPLAVAYGEAGQLEKGVKVYRRSLQYSSIPVIWSDGVSELFARWAKSHPADLAVQLETAQVLFFHGRFRRALEMLRTREANFKDDVSYRDMMNKLRVAIAQAPVTS